MQTAQAIPQAPKQPASPPLFSGRDLFKIILPLILQQILSIAIGTADSMMVSYAGEAAVSGVSLVNTLDTLLVLVFSSLVTGGSVVVAQSLGRRDMDKANDAVKQLLYAATIISTLLTVTVVTLRRPLLSLLFGSVEAEVMQQAEGYFLFISLSFPFLAIEYANAASFRAMGNSMVSMLVSIMMNLVNVAGNALFIFVFEWGAVGAAVATLISRILGALVMLLLIGRKSNMVRIEHLFRYKPDFAVIRSILHIGVPHGIENGMFQLGKLLTQTLISTMPTAAIAANAVANTLANIQYMTGSAFSTTMVTVVGRCVGAREKEQAKRYTRLLLGMNYAALFIMAGLTMLFANPLIGMYDLSAESSTLAYRLILYHSLLAVLVWPVCFTLPAAFHAASDVRFPLVVSMFSMWAFRVALSYCLAPTSLELFSLSLPALGMGVLGVWVAMFVDWFFRFGMYLHRLLTDRWLRAKNL